MKKLYLLIASLSIIINSTGQTFNGTGQSSVKQLSYNGTYFIYGVEFQDTLFVENQKYHGSVGTKNVALVAGKADGTTAWVASFSPNASSEINIKSLVCDASGNTYVCGQIKGTIDYSNNRSLVESFNKKAAYLAKISSTGDILWAYAVPANSSLIETEGMGVAIIENEVFLGIKLKGGSLSLGEIQLTNPGTKTVASILKFNTLGSLISGSTVLTCGNEDANLELIASNGSEIWVLGSLKKNAGILGLRTTLNISNPLSQEIGVLGVLDKDFNALNVLNIGSSNKTKPKTLQLAGDNVFIGGEFENSFSIGEFAFENYPKKSSFLVAYKNKQVDWAWAANSSAPNSSETKINKMAVFGDTLYVVGQFIRSIIFGENDIQRDVKSGFLLKVNTQNYQIESLTAANSISESNFESVATSNDDLIIGGNFSDNISFDDFNIDFPENTFSRTGLGLRIKLKDDATNFLFGNNIANRSLAIHPNPSYNFIKVSETGNFEVLNLQGIRMNNVTYIGSTENTKLDVSNLEPGVYLLKNTQNGKVQSFIKK
ncbi:MAG: T9SS type A sorting domain-containing protein [Cytophagales bacterium]